MNPLELVRKCKTPEALRGQGVQRREGDAARQAYDVLRAI
nr:MAG TPA: hypothetical protein [Bacteriophage sp.]